jgi:hypothetical protein
MCINCTVVFVFAGPKWEIGIDGQEEYGKRRGDNANCSGWHSHGLCGKRSTSPSFLGMTLLIIFYKANIVAIILVG